MMTGDYGGAQTEGLGHPLPLFFLSAFSITWSLAIVVMLAPGTVERLLGPIGKHNPLFYVAVYAPTISAAVIIARRLGWAGLAAFARRILPSKAEWVWVPISVLLLALILGAARLVTGIWTGESPSPARTGWGFLSMALFLLVADAGPIGEEIGWSGFAYPLLQKRFSPSWSSLVLGTIWVFWHVPQFAIGGLGKDSADFVPSFLGFLFVLTSLRILIGVLFNACRGAIIVPILCHWMHNLSDPGYLGILGESRLSGVVLGALYLAAAVIVGKLVRPPRFTEPVP